MISLESSGSPGAYSNRPPDAALAFVRICTHYFSHGAWLEEGELLAHAGRLAGIPGVLLHGRLDLGSPVGTAWELAQAWPGSELVVVDDFRPHRQRHDAGARAPGDGALHRSTLSRGASRQAVTAVTTPATNATASVSRRNVAAGRRRPRLVPIAFATRTPGSHHTKARPASLLS